MGVIELYSRSCLVSAMDQGRNADERVLRPSSVMARRDAYKGPVSKRRDFEPLAGFPYTV